MGRVRGTEVPKYGCADVRSTEVRKYGSTGSAEYGTLNRRRETPVCRTGFLDARTLGERRPELRCIFISGYPQEHTERYGGMQGSEWFVQKPLDFGVLVELARSLLAGDS